MNRSIIIYTIICAIFISWVTGLSVAQTDDGDVPVARIGPTDITRDEFRKRFELTPWPGKHREGFLDVIKEEILYSMIAERLLALEAERREYTEDRGVQQMVERMKRFYVKDQLYTDEVQGAVEVEEEDLRQEYFRSKTDASVSFLFFESRAEADMVYERIEAGTPFDRIVIDNPEHMISDHHVDWDMTHPNLIDVLDNMEPGDVSNPVPTEYGFYIVKLEDLTVDPLMTEAEFNRLKPSLEKELRSRWEKPAAREFVGEVIGETHIQVHSRGMGLLLTEMERVLEQKRAMQFSGNPMIVFNDLDFDEMIAALNDDLDTSLITYGDHHWAVGEMLNQLRLFGVWFQQDADVPVLPQLRNIIEDVVVDEVLSNKGLERNYHELPDIRREIETWKNHFIAELLKRDVIRDIELDEDDLYEYYEVNREQFVRPVEVNIREIRVDTRAEANNILVQLDSGRDFEELARLHSRRKWAAEQGGEFGFFPSTLYGDIGRIAVTLEPGERFGPLQVPEGYSIFKLIDKREPEEDLNQPFEEVKESIASIMTREKSDQIISRIISDIADEYPVSIDYDVLDGTEVTQIQMFAIRYFGFGGKYPAVPMLDRQIGWIFEGMKDQMIIP